MSLKEESSFCLEVSTRLEVSYIKVTFNPF